MKEASQESENIISLFDEEDLEFIDEVTAKSKASNKAKADFFDGIQFQFRLDSVQLKICSSENPL